MYTIKYILYEDVTIRTITSYINDVYIKMFSNIAILKISCHINYFLNIANSNIFYNF